MSLPKDSVGFLVSCSGVLNTNIESIQKENVIICETVSWDLVEYLVCVSVCVDQDLHTDLYMQFSGVYIKPIFPHFTIIMKIFC